MSAEIEKSVGQGLDHVILNYLPEITSEFYCHLRLIFDLLRLKQQENGLYPTLQIDGTIWARCKMDLLVYV